MILPLDVANFSQVDRAAEKVEREFGPIDVWVNDAMVSVFSPVKETSADEYRRVTEVTYLGYVNGTLAALKRMQARDRGVIIQVSSALGFRSIPLQSAYCAAKHAIVGFTESLRTELIHDKSRVRVTMVHLPAANTPQFGWVKSRLPNKPQPVPPIFQPEVPARAIFFAAHHSRREIDVGFPTLKAITIEKIAPSVADNYLARTGYSSQQTSEAADPNRPNNVWRPVAGDPGCHGSFDSRARSFSFQLAWTKNRNWILLSVTALSALIKLFRGPYRSRSSTRSSRDWAPRGLRTRRDERPASA